MSLDHSLAAWRDFLERLPNDHPLRRILLETTDAAAEETILRLAAIVESSDDAILSKTLDGRILSWNAGAQRLYGYTPEEVLGRDVRLLLPSDHADDVESILERIRRGEAVSHHETTRRHKDGRLIDVSLTVSPVRDAAGRIVAASTIARDITSRKRTERHLQFLSDASSVLASSLDYETTLTSVARLAIPRLADWCCVDLVLEPDTLRRVAVAQRDKGQEEAAQAAFVERPPPRPRIGSSPPICRALRERQAALVTEVTDDLLRDLAHDEAHLDALRAQPLTSAIVVPLVARERVLGVVSVGVVDGRPPYDEQDLELAGELARRAALAIDNARLYREAQAANRAKDEFLATLSHELRTPLTPILGWTRILRSGKADNEATQLALEVIERNVQSQAVLINDLLDLSRIITGRLSLDLAQLDLADVVQASVASVQAAADARGVRLEVSAGNGVPRVSGDPDRLQQVLWNLLSNGIKFTPRGGCVSVRVAGSEDEALIAVSDNGEGIAPAVLPYVFDRFRQADSSATRRHGGLGLGLSLVKHLVELHGGTVSATSEGLGRGATFTVRLPAC